MGKVVFFAASGHESRVQEVILGEDILEEKWGQEKIRLTMTTRNVEQADELDQARQRPSILVRCCQLDLAHNKLDNDHKKC